MNKKSPKVCDIWKFENAGCYLITEIYKDPRNKRRVTVENIETNECWTDYPADAFYASCWELISRI